MWGQRFLIVILLVIASATACTDVNPNPAPAESINGAAGMGQKNGPLSVVDQTNGNVVACDPQKDVNLFGPNGQGKICDRESKTWILVMSVDADCKFSDNAFDPLSCVFTPCKTADDCADNIASTTDACEWIEGSYAKGTGMCRNYFAACKAKEGTPCAAIGAVVKDKDSNYTCDAVAKMALAETETCNNVDDDCDGTTDNGKNVDGSAFNIGKACDGGDSDKCANGTWTCSPTASGAECINETKKDIAEVCNGIDDNCDGVIDDPWPTLGKACDGDDSDKCKNGVDVCNNAKDGVSCLEVGKNVDEICNGSDDNCNGTTDEACDMDNDGYCTSKMLVAKTAKCLKSKLPADASTPAGDDCNDLSVDTHPGATEMCNELDDNCNAQTDEGFSLGLSCVSGNADGVCTTTGKFSSCSADSLSAVCDAKKDVNKIATEICDNLDNDCNGKTDEGCDDDSDGYCDAKMKVSKDAKCAKSKLPSDASTPAGDDCDDAAKAVNPGATEICNGLDDQCDAKTDEGCDDDVDGYCDAKMAFAAGAACKQSAAGVGDCDDAVKAINPDAAEVCDNVDNNCDGKIDQNAAGQSVCASVCGNAVFINCGGTTVLSMKTDNPFKGLYTPAGSYTCPKVVGGATQVYTSNTAAAELYIVVQGNGMKTANLKINAPAGGNGMAAVLTDCTSKNAAFSALQCSQQGVFGTTSSGTVVSTNLTGVKVGGQVVAIDSSIEIDKVSITVTCQ